MNAMIYVIVGALGLAMFLGICWTLAKFHSVACRTCPNKAECDQRENDKNYVPHCIRMQMDNPIHYPGDSII